MDARIAELKNNLSRFLKQLAATGEPITIYDRNNPIAKIVPIRKKASRAQSEWDKERDQLLKRAEKLGIKLSVSTKPPTRGLKVSPSPAPDGRVDIETVVSMRREKDY